MRSRMIAFIIGIAGFWIIPESFYSLWTLVATVIVPVFLIITVTSFSFSSKIKSLVVLLCCIIGFVLSMHQHHSLRNYQQQLLPHTETIEISGTILSTPIQYHNFISFKLQLDSIQSKKLQPLWKPSLQLNWYQNNRINMQNPAQGDRWRFNLRLKSLHGMRNPESFDYERWGWSKRIIARGYIDNRQQQTAIALNHDFINSWRKLIANTLQTAMPENAAVAASLLIGDKSGLSQSTKQSLQASGLAHLLAISGLHIGMVAVIGFWFALRLWKCSSRLCMFLPAIDVAVIFSVVLATIYALLSGWGLPAQRALLMLLIFSLNHLLRIQWKLFDIVLLSLTVLIMINPVTILDSSGWLSFGAVFIIVGLLRFQQKHISGLKSALKNWVLFSLLLWLALLPFSLILFSKLALLGWLANLVSIPLMSFVIMPLLLFSAVLCLFSIDLAKLLFILADKFLSLIDFVSQRLSAAGFEIADADRYGIVLAALLLLWFLPRALITAKFVMMVSVIAGIFLYFGITPPKTGARLLVFDVGQGLAVVWEDYSVLEQKPIRLLFDTGYGNEFYQSAETTWLPYFKTPNINKINGLIISHNDADHSGGLTTFKKNIDADFIYFGQPLPNHSKNQSCHHHQNLDFGNTKLKFLPTYAEDELLIQKDNNQSCVVVIGYFGNKVLLPGDIEVAAERRLIQNKLLQPVEVVVAPHHGSNTSSSEEFIDTIQPIYSLFSTGFLNRYKFPRNKVIKRYQKKSTILLNTAEVGAIECKWQPLGKFEGCFGLREQDWGRWHWQLSQ